MRGRGVPGRVDGSQMVLSLPTGCSSESQEASMEVPPLLRVCGPVLGLLGPHTQGGISIPK